MNLIRAKMAIGVLSGVAACMALALYGSAGWAQQAESTTAAPSESAQLEEIVITAQKRTERLSDVPVSAAVVSSDTLANINASDISDLNRLVPSVNLNGTFNGRVPMGIRGISSVSNEGTVGLSSGVAILIDGVPVPSDSLAGDQLNDMDIQSIEVLKGPQATLGGRTAASGVINIVTRKPGDTPTGDLSLSGTTDSEWRVSGFLSGPITSGVDYSLSAYDNERQYPIENTQLDHWSTQRTSGVRAKLLFKPTDDLDITLTGRYALMTSNGFNFVYEYLTPGTTLLVGPGGPPFLSQAALLPGITPGWGNEYYNSPIDAGSRYEDRDASINVEWRLGGGLTFGSVTAIQHETQAYAQDLFAVSGYFWNELTGGHAPPFNNQQNLYSTVQQFSQEFKLASSTDQDFSYLIGAFYSDGKVYSTQFRSLLPAYDDVGVSPDTKTTDAYIRTTWKFLPETSLVTSLRYNYDKLSYQDFQQLYTFSFPPPNIGANQYAAGSTSKSEVVGDVSLKQQFTPEVMGYITYARGYSPEAYNTTQAISSNPAQAAPTLGIAPTETINHFEIGTKGTYLDRTLTANLDVFFTKYNNFQVQNFDESSDSINPPLILESAGAETKGVEFDTQWAATPQTRLGLAFAYVDATFTNYKNAPCYYSDSATVATPPGCVPGTAFGVVTNVWPSLDGKPMPNAPKVKFDLNGEQRFPLEAIPYSVVLGGNFSFRDSAQMLADQNPHAVMPSVGILDLNLGLVSQSGKISITAFVDNLTNKHYATDVEDFWSSPWGHKDAVIMQPARDSYRYGGIRVSVGF
ncbi:MAG TPA: TonB-dependent receptor [Steroidobacteraceae bacterium]|nr:TonB-dependent receptor [Steroidobacteraceae bacterium]